MPRSRYRSLSSGLSFPFRRHVFVRRRAVFVHASFTLCLIGTALRWFSYCRGSISIALIRLLSVTIISVIIAFFSGRKHLATTYFQAAHALVYLSGNCLSTVPFCIVEQATLFPAAPDVQCRNGWFLAIRLVHGLNHRTVGPYPRPRPFLSRRGLSLFMRLYRLPRLARPRFPT